LSEFADPKFYHIASHRPCGGPHDSCKWRPDFQSTQPSAFGLGSQQFQTADDTFIMEPTDRIMACKSPPPKGKDAGSSGRANDRTSLFSQ